MWLCISNLKISENNCAREVIKQGKVLDACVFPKDNASIAGSSEKTAHHSQFDKNKQRKSRMILDIILIDMKETHPDNKYLV